jgi:hypothetical protein
MGTWCAPVGRQVDTAPKKGGARGFNFKPGRGCIWRKSIIYNDFCSCWLNLPMIRYDSHRKDLSETHAHPIPPDQRTFDIVPSDVLHADSVSTPPTRRLAGRKGRRSHRASMLLLLVRWSRWACAAMTLSGWRCAPPVPVSLVPVRWCHGRARIGEVAPGLHCWRLCRTSPYKSSICVLRHRFTKPKVTRVPLLIRRCQMYGVAHELLQ